MNSKIKGIIGALVLVIIGLLLTPVVVNQVQSNTKVQTCPTEANKGLSKKSDATAVAHTIPVTVDVVVPVLTDVATATTTYRVGTLCAFDAGHATLSKVVDVSDANDLALASQKAGALAYDSTGAKEIMNLITIFWVLGVLGCAVGLIYVQFRSQ